MAFKYPQPAIGAHVGMFICEIESGITNGVSDYTPDEIFRIIKVVCKEDAEKWTKHRVQAIK